MSKKVKKSKRHEAPQYDFWKQAEPQFHPEAWFKSVNGQWDRDAWLAQFAPKPAANDYSI